MDTFIPSGEYDREVTQGSVKTAISSAQAKSGDLWMVPVENIRVPPGLNIRVHDEEYEERIEKLKDSIIANGFYRHFPLAGYVAKEGDKQVIYCTGGFTRLEAAKRAIKAGAPIKELPVVMRPPGTSMADLTVGLVVDNTGTPLSPYEKGIAIKRLVGFGWDEKEIALRLGITVNYLKELLYLHGLPQALQQLVVKRDVTAGYATKMARQLGPMEALKLFQDEIEKLNVDDPPIGEGETTPLDTDGSKGRERPKRTKQPGHVTSRTALGAIDYAITLDDGIEFLIRWRKGEKKAAEEVKKHLSKKAAPAEPKKRGRKKKEQPDLANVDPISEADIDRTAMTEITKAADRIAREEGDNGYAGDEDGREDDEDEL